MYTYIKGICFSLSFSFFHSLFFFFFFFNIVYIKPFKLVNLTHVIGKFHISFFKKTTPGSSELIYQGFTCIIKLWIYFLISPVFFF
jgi:hypothetical protein